MPRAVLISLAVLLLAAPALGAPEIAVAPFTGPGAAAVRAQVVRTLCDSLDCSSTPPPLSGEGVFPVLHGRVASTRKAKLLEVWLVYGAREKWRKSYPLPAGKLSADSLAKARAAVFDSLGALGPAEPARRVEAPPEAGAEPDEEESPVRRTRAVTASAADEGGRAEPDADATAGTLERPAAGYAPPIIEASINLELLYRAFRLDALSTRNLHEYSGFPIAAPRLHLDLYPLARATESLARGLGLEADFSFSLGLRAVAGPTSYPSQLMRLAAGAKFRLPFTASGIAVVPAVGFTRTSFSHSAADGGAELEGLPGVAYTGMSVAVGFEAPLLDQKLLLGARFAILPVFASGEVIGDDYFRDGSSWGLLFNAGVSYRVLPMLELRAGFQLERYGLTFDVRPADRYVAAGASDLLLGGALGAGYLF